MILMAAIALSGVLSVAAGRLAAEFREKYDQSKDDKERDNLFDKRFFSGYMCVVLAIVAVVLGFSFVLTGIRGERADRQKETWISHIDIDSARHAEHRLQDADFYELSQMPDWAQKDSKVVQAACLQARTEAALRAFYDSGVQPHDSQFAIWQDLFTIYPDKDGWFKRSPSTWPDMSNERYAKPRELAEALLTHDIAAVHRVLNRDNADRRSLYLLHEAAQTAIDRLKEADLVLDGAADPDGLCE